MNPVSPVSPVSPVNPVNPVNPMGFSATCPACGTTGYYGVSGRVWFACANCGWSGYQWAIPVAGVAGAGAGGIARQLRAAGAGVQTTPGTPPSAQSQQPWMANLSLVGLPDLTSYNGGLVNPGGDDTIQPMTLPAALATDARLYGEEIARTLLDRGDVACERDCRLTVPQVWDGIQEAQGALFEALGGRLHMGDFAPDLEQVSRALVGVGVWSIIALQVAGQMGDDGAGGDSGDAA